MLKRCLPIRSASLRDAGPIRSASLRDAGLILLLLALWFWTPPPAVAQTPAITWSRPTNLSNTPTASAHPAIVTDDYGYVHVLWSEEYGGHAMEPDEHIANTGNTIFYTRWDGYSWLPPVDILLVPGESIAEYPVAAIDADSTIHVVWESMTNVYYSQAPSWQADSSSAWSPPVLLVENIDSVPWGADVTADRSGGLHVVYTGSRAEAGVYYTRSSDGGQSWQAPIKLSAPLQGLEEQYTMLQIVSDGAGRLHAVWSANQDGGLGEAVYYVHSLDGGDSWGTVLQVANRSPEEFHTGAPYLEVRDGSELHFVYVDGLVTGSLGRYHRISYDGGATWSAPNHVITELMGMNGLVEPVVDGAGGLHLIANMRTFSTQVVGVYYARWLGRGWSPVTPIDVSQSSTHYTVTAVRLGNEIHLVYTQLAGGEIWHVWGMIPSVPQRAPRPLPALAAAVPLSAPVAESSPSVAPSETTPTAVPSPAPQFIDQIAAGQSASFPGSPLLFSAAVSLLIVTGVITWRHVRARRHR